MAAAEASAAAAEALLARSKAWAPGFPTKANLLSSLVSGGILRQSEIVERYAQHCNGVLHYRVYRLLGRFLEHKRRYGSAVEQQLYQGMQVSQADRQRLMGGGK